MPHLALSIHDISVNISNINIREKYATRRQKSFLVWYRWNIHRVEECLKQKFRDIYEICSLYDYSMSS
jgi:hypothetical protein